MAIHIDLGGIKYLDELQTMVYNSYSSTLSKRQGKHILVALVCAILETPVRPHAHDILMLYSGIPVTMTLWSYFSASQIVFGGVSFARRFPAAQERAKSSAFFGSATIILILGLILCMD